MGNLLNEIGTYNNQVGFKAIAVAQSGYGVAHICRDCATQEIATQVILERCQIEANNLPCAIFAEGPTIKYDQADFFNNFVSVLETGPRILDFSKVPGTSTNFRTDLAGAIYAGRPEEFKAITLGYRGAAGLGFSANDQEEANRLAMEDCEMKNGIIAPCTLYAETNTVVFNVQGFELNAEFYIDYGPKPFDPARVPFVRDTRRENELAVVALQAGAGNLQYVAISIYNNMGIDANQQTALDECNSQITNPDAKHECFIYSYGGNVLMTRDVLDNSHDPF